MSQNKQKRIVLVGGGTGGHVVPIYEIYQRLKSMDPSLQIVVVGSGGEIERNFYGTLPNYYVIFSGKLRRHVTPRNITEFIKFSLGVFQSGWFLIRHRPQLIFAKGGHTTLPLLLAAHLLRIPCYIHESDAKMGIANRIASRWAKKVFVSYPIHNYPQVAAGKIIFSGPLVKTDSIPAVAQKEFFEFTKDQPTIFITGGSQGSLPMNKGIVPALPKLLDRFNIIHQTGEYSYNWVMSFRDELPLEKRQNYFVTDFLRIEGGRNRMSEAIALADLVITRGGNNTISELSLVGKPMIIVPWKHSAGNHQLKNARLLEEQGAAIVITDDDLGPRVITEAIEKLFDGDGTQLKVLGENARKVFPSDGLEKIAGSITGKVK